MTFEAAMFVGIIAVVISAIWAITRCWRLPRSLQGSTERLSALRMLPIVFVLVDLLYVLPLPIRLLFTREIDGSIAPNLLIFIGYFPLALILDAFFLALFAFFYRIGLVRYKAALQFPARSKRLSRVTFLLLWIAMFLISIVLIVGLAKAAGGVIPLILQGYGVTETFSGNGLYAIGIPWLASLSLLFLVYMRMCKSKAGQLISLVLVAVECMSFLIMGRRSVLVYFGLALLVIYHFLYRRLGLKSICVIIFSGFLAMNLLGLIRGDSYTSVSGAIDTLNTNSHNVSSNGNLDLFYTLTTGNFVEPFQTMPNIMAHMGQDIELQWGGSLLRGIALLVPQSLWTDRPEPLANWYMRKFIDNNAMDNQGRQFFFLSGSYLDFGLLGPPLMGILYGLIYASVGAWLARRLDNPVHLTLFALLIGSTLNLISSDTMGGLIVFIKVTAAPCFVLLLAAAAGRYRNTPT